MTYILLVLLFLFEILAEKKCSVTLLFLHHQWSVFNEKINNELEFQQLPQYPVVHSYVKLWDYLGDIMVISKHAEEGD